MSDEQLIVEVPSLSDEAAALLQRFLYDLMYAIDEQYYSQIQRYYVNKSKELLLDAHLTNEKLDTPPF
jgi:hypothetical protein